MRLEKAIEITSDPAWQEIALTDPDVKEAHRLLIQAGELVITMRCSFLLILSRLLPGETED